jgi:hypothetical protein
MKMAELVNTLRKIVDSLALADHSPNVLEVLEVNFLFQNV